MLWLIPQRWNADLQRFVPRNYFEIPIALDGSVTGPGRQDTVFVATAQTSSEANPNCEPMVVVVRDGKLIWKYKLQYESSVTDASDRSGRKLALQLRDLTGDGRPEVLVIAESVGVSGGTNTLYVFRWTGKTFAKCPSDHPNAFNLKMPSSIYLDLATKPPTVVLGIHEADDREDSKFMYERHGKTVIARYRWNGRQFAIVRGRKSSAGLLRIL